jgi:hypothetical protein
MLFRLKYHLMYSLKFNNFYNKKLFKILIYGISIDHKFKRNL